MNNYKITFRVLRDLHESIQKGSDEELVQYLNSLPGNNVFHKFKSVLNLWSNDISPSLPLANGDKVTNVQIKYLLSEMHDLSDNLQISGPDFSAIIDISDEFFYNGDIIPIYTVLKSISMFNITLDLSKMSMTERKTIIDKLPAHIYSDIITKIISEKNKTLKFSNSALENLSLNFLSNEPYLFLKSMFSKYDDFYFRDIVWYLSPKLGSNLYDSTIQDVEYYLRKLSDSGQTDITL